MSDQTGDLAFTPEKTDDFRSMTHAYFRCRLAFGAAVNSRDLRSLGNPAAGSAASVTNPEDFNG
mgnify:CR=1 FL=1